MNELNGIIISGKVFEAVETEKTYDKCYECDCDNNARVCLRCNHICGLWKCYFRFSRELTDKLNKK